VKVGLGTSFVRRGQGPDQRPGKGGLAGAQRSPQQHRVANRQARGDPPGQRLGRRCVRQAPTRICGSVLMDEGFSMGYRGRQVRRIKAPAREIA
jgi:hypothetical protein